MTPKSSIVYVIEGPGVRSGNKSETTNSCEKEYSYDEALDIIGYGKVQLVALISCGLILMAVLCETMGMMIIVIASQCDLNIQIHQKGMLTGVAFFGILITSYFWGFMQDRYGRRNVILYSMFIAVLFSFSAVLTNNFWIFLLLRLCCGISISGPSAGIYAYLGEFNATRHRQTTISWASIFVGFACTFIPGIASIILPQTWSYPLYEGLDFRPWKLTLIIYSLPGLLGAIMLLWMPETPKFLLSQNREREAFKIVEWIYVKNTGKSAQTFEVKKLLQEGNIEYLDSLEKINGFQSMLKSVWRQTVPLLRKPNLGTLLICCVAQFGIFFASGGMALWFPEIQNQFNSRIGEPLTVCNAIDLTQQQRTSASNATTIEVCDDSINPKVFADASIIGILYIIGYIVLAIIINPVGRVILLPTILIMSGLSGLTLLWITDPTAIVLFFAGYLMLAGICVSVVNGAIVDLIPTHLRGMAVCLQLSVGRLGSIVGSNLVALLLYRDCFSTFSFYSGFIIFCGLLTILLPKSVKTV